MMKFRQSFAAIVLTRMFDSQKCTCLNFWNSVWENILPNFIKRSYSNHFHDCKLPKFLCDSLSEIKINPRSLFLCRLCHNVGHCSWTAAVDDDILEKQTAVLHNLLQHRYAQYFTYTGRPKPIIARGGAENQSETTATPNLHPSVENCAVIENTLSETDDSLHWKTGKDSGYWVTYSL